MVIRHAKAVRRELIYTSKKKKLCSKAIYFTAFFLVENKVGAIYSFCSVSFQLYKQRGEYAQEMSDSTAPQAPASSNIASETKPADPPAPVQETTAAPETKDAVEDPAGADSLEKLLAHISSLKRENNELEEAMKHVREGNMQKLKSQINEKIQPWISSLDIAEEYKNSFLKGIENACSTGASKTMTNFEENPVYTVVCSAAAAHGIAIQELEDTRKKLRDAEELHKTELENHGRRIQSKTDEALLYARSDNSGNSGKRSHDEFSSDADGNLWDSMFKSMTDASSTKIW